MSWNNQLIVIYAIFPRSCLCHNLTLIFRCFVNGKMRGVLVDWLIEVHSQFKLLQETLYMTIYIIDKFLQVKPVLVDL